MREVIQVELNNIANVFQNFKRVLVNCLVA